MSIVITDVEWVLWTDAQKHLEWSATKFWEHKLQKRFRAEDGWVVSSQQPPTRAKSDRRRVETTIELLYNNSLQKLLIVEAKFHNASQSEIQEVEAQTYEACLKYLKDSQRSEMYAMTLVGTRARLWIAYRTQDYLEPFVPEHRGLAAIEEYIEANSTDGHLIMNGLEHMKLHNLLPPKKSQILRSLGSPEPSHTAPLDTDIAMADDTTAGASQYYPLPRDADHVELEVEIDGEEYFYRFKHNESYYRVAYSSWMPSSTTYEDAVLPCVFYTGVKTGKHFWAWSLDGYKAWKGKVKK